jgi:tRNA threonylcarbamoyladenosine biosynthesis protein TsaB
MLVLGLDTSESPGSVALMDDAGLAVERSLPEPFRHAECLLPTVEILLQECGRTRDDIARICVNLGPGSFTGLRIGLATAKGMSQARGIELVGVDGMAAYRERAGAAERVCVVIASRRDLVYARWFSGAKPRTETAMMRVSELADRLQAETRPLCVVGSAAQRVVALAGNASRAVLGPEDALCPSALAVARVGAALRAARLYEVEPMYVEPILA